MQEPQSLKKGIVLGSAAILCWIFHLMILFTSHNTIDLFLAPMLKDELGGKLIYAVLYSLFYISIFLLFFFKCKKYYIPVFVVLLFETINIFLPAFYYGNQYGSRHFRLYLQSLFADRLLFTLKSVLLVLIFAAFLALCFLQTKNVRILLKIAVPVLAVLILLTETVYFLSPEVNAEMLSFQTKITTSFLCDFLRFAPLISVALIL